MKENMNLSGNVVARLIKGDWKDGKWVPLGIELEFVGKNIVTDGGDTFYATKATTKTVPKNFASATAGVRLGYGTTGGGDKGDTDVNTKCTAAGVGYYNRLSSTSTYPYPQTNDTEASNSGATTDCVTWYYYWYASQGSATKINEGAIVDSATNPTAALCHWDFGTTFDKTTSDTLELFINHTLLGV